MKFLNAERIASQNRQHVAFQSEGNALIFDKQISGVLLDKFKIDLGKLAIWRIATHPHWNAKWLSDYVDNYLGGFEGEEMDTPDDNFDLQ